MDVGERHHGEGLMKRSLVKLISLSYLMIATNFMAISCSSSEEGAEGEEVAADDGNEAANADDNAANEEGAEGNANANTAANEGGEGANNFGNEGNQAAPNEFGNGAEGTGAGAGDNLATAEGNAATGEEAVNQIIEEMNNTGAPADATAAAPVAEGTENLSANSAPVDGNAAAAAPAEAAAPAAASSAPAAPGLPELGSKMVYIVQKGDTLAKVAQRIYGDTNKWTEIADFTGIANPNLVYPGDIVYYQLTESTQAFANTYESIARSEVEVAQGDTLATISNRVFGNSTLWKLIWRQNDKISNPDKLEAGTKLYYIDSAKLTAFDKSATTTFVSIKGKKEAKKVVKSVTSKFKPVKSQVSKSLEVANESVTDQFSSMNSHNLVARLI
jgi:nucleoid-associated protein YgaU